MATMATHLLRNGSTFWLLQRCRGSRPLAVSSGKCNAHVCGTGSARGGGGRHTRMLQRCCPMFLCNRNRTNRNNYAELRVCVRASERASNYEPTFGMQQVCQTETQRERERACFKRKTRESAQIPQGGAMCYVFVFVEIRLKLICLFLPTAGALPAPEQLPGQEGCLQSE